MNKVTCMRCQGQGSQVWDEDNYRAEDVCYLCGGEGKTDPETASEVLLQQCAAAMARAAVAKLRDEADNNPEGENWAFLAAENMVSERDYTLAREVELQDRFMSELEKLSTEAKDALVEALLRAGWAKPEESKQDQDPDPQADASDDIPF